MRTRCSFGKTRTSARYTITLAPIRDGGIQEEQIVWGDDDKVILKRERFDVYFPAKDAKISAQSGLESALYRTSSETPETMALADAIRSWSLYDFQRARVSEIQPVRRETRLNKDGSNAATVLHSLLSEDMGTFERIESLLKAAIPEIERLLSPLDSREAARTLIAFQEKYISRRIPAWNISEGSARLVATLLAILGPNIPSLVAIESPESALHPYLYEYLADIIKIGSQETQILMTTHSPYLLNYLPPDSLVIVSKERGQTKAKRVRKQRALKEAVKVLGLGEMWFAGHLGGVP